jgi:hypothetical protein
MNNMRDQEDRVREIKERYASRLIQYPNVTGVGVGLRLVNGERKNEVCVRVYVSRKLPEAQLQTTEILPRTLDGVDVDVIEGEFTFMQDNAPPLSLEQRVARNFPFLNPGVSVGGLRVTAGTLGAVVYDVAGGGQMLLSNWHVLCGSPDCVQNEEIVQPGVFDGGVAPKDTIAVLKRFAHTDRVDAAVAVVNEQRFLRDAIPGIGVVRSINVATLGMRVRKSGRTTGITIGIIDDISADVVVSGLQFRDQISVVPEDGGVIVAGGDSGSLVVDEQNLAVGLLFGGQTDGLRWIANQIEDVIDALQIRFTPELSPLNVASILAATEIND